MAEWEKQIGAINLIVGDLERSKAFYRDVFELPLQHEDENTAMFRFPDTYVFLQRGTGHQDGPNRRRAQPGPEGGWAIRHLR
jgi:catechol 2,3-dioxygenase-like lactoylglutathione lyase family enzyme